MQKLRVIALGKRFEAVVVGKLDPHWDELDPKLPEWIVYLVEKGRMTHDDAIQLMMDTEGHLYHPTQVGFTLEEALETLLPTKLAEDKTAAAKLFHNTRTQICKILELRGMTEKKGGVGGKYYLVPLILQYDVADYELAAFEVTHNESKMPYIQKALSLYTGHFLPNCHEAWAMKKRAELANVQIRLLKLASLMSLSMHKEIAAHEFINEAVRLDAELNLGRHDELMQQKLELPTD